MGPYFYKVKMQILVQLTYRFEVFATLAARYVQIVATIFLWKCVYGGQQEINGLTQEQMITWTILSAGLSTVYSCSVQEAIRNGVRQGSVAIELIRPCSLLGQYLAQDVGSMVVNLLIRVVPVVVLGGLTFGLTAPADGIRLLLCAISVVFGYLILWLMYALVSMFTFVALELGDMDVVLRTVIEILSGSLVPLWFFPQAIQRILAWLPFQYTFQTPLGLYIGKISAAEGMVQIRIQMIWILFFFACLNGIWAMVRKNILIQGG